MLNQSSDGATPLRFEDGKAMLIAGIRQRHDFASAQQTIPSQWRRLIELGEIPRRVDGSHYGVICGADSSGMEFMCGVEVASFADLPTGLGRMRVPEQKYAVFAHDPESRPTSATWQQVFDWLTRSSFDSAHKPDFERYAPGVDPLRPEGGVEIWLGIVSRNTANAG